MDNDKADSTVFKEDLEELYEEAPCGYLSILENGKILKVNGTFVKWVGYSRKELVNQMKFKELLEIGSKIFYDTHFTPLLKMQKYVNEVNLDLLSKAGEKRPVLISSTLKETSTCNIFRITVFNISDRKKYEQELMLEKKRAKKEVKIKENILSVMSHEIRNPMNAVVGITQLLAKTRLSTEQKKYVDLLDKSSNNILTLLSSILDYSRIESGCIVLKNETFNLENSVKEIVYPLEVIANNKNIKFNVLFDDKIPPRLEGDFSKIAQVLTNLVSNAIKFTKKGEVTLRISNLETKKSYANIKFEVLDSGIGIKADRQENIFIEFCQADEDIGVLYGGTGLGLSICKKFVEVLGGKIEVQSQLGVGSKFFFNLQLRVSEKVLSPQTSDKFISDKNALIGLHLLVAEDAIENQMILEVLLQNWGITFNIANNGVEAVELAKNNTFDLILMDIHMPKMDGREASALIRKNNILGNKNKVPIVAFTASNFNDFGNLENDLNFSDYINKPFRSEELFEKIRKWSGKNI